MKVYSVEVTEISDAMSNKLSLFIESEKKSRIEKLVNKKDKIRVLIGEILIRTLIIKHLGIKNDEILFKRNRFGKPFLTGFSGFHFNISHSGEFVVCAIDENPIGIDIEQVKNINYEHIAMNFFSKSENNYIFKSGLDNQLKRFYELWTLKESYIKCCGQGLAIPLKSFSIEINNHKNIYISSGNESMPKSNGFKMLNFEPGYKVALCSLNSEFSPKNIITLNQLTLIEEFLKNTII
ncbi:4'-phosphopantetheinyl transferase family protein [Psychrobacillus sp. L4]|uniref:4'-phosphopantetheinyl transferase family protein n=1 Tax=Psychrobacillus sp. L4 TaxID=3236892 RepID=UPI0036F1FCE2